MRTRVVLLAMPLLLAGAGTLAENMNPGSDGSKYAWSENLGWLNAQPGGPGGPGVHVSGASLTGWMWSENAGWISLSCANTSCAPVGYGVTNDGCGTLAGYAWSENLGWINFAPATCGGDPTCGVRIVPTTGIFGGRAWSENAGWVTFASAGPNPYQMATAWRALPPAGSSVVTATTPGGFDVSLAWTALAGATEYDVVAGDLNALRASGGNFQSATLGPVECRTAGGTVTDSADPSVGNGYWFLVRGRNCGGVGTYDSGDPGQVGLRDAEIAASGHDCSP
jgi:hypothetical protein